MSPIFCTVYTLFVHTFFPKICCVARVSCYIEVTRCKIKFVQADFSVNFP
jgi:hypothetical protein